jgi:hypothetical protein
MSRLMTLSATVISRIETGESDSVGDPIIKEVKLETRCALQQRRREEHEDGGEISDTLWNLFLPFGTEIDTGDAVEVNGQRYELAGEPWTAQEGSRSLWHVEATVHRTGGAGT